MTSDTIDKRRPTWMLLEVVAGEKNDKKQLQKSKTLKAKLRRAA